MKANVEGLRQIFLAFSAGGKIGAPYFFRFVCFAGIFFWPGVGWWGVLLLSCELLALGLYLFAKYYCCSRKDCMSVPSSTFYNVNPSE